MTRDDGEPTPDDAILDRLLQLYFDAQEVQELFGDEVHTHTWVLLDEIKGRVDTAMYFQRTKGTKGKGETR